jgi:hypothetical protein
LARLLHKDSKGKAVIEDLTSPSSPPVSDVGECSVSVKKAKSRKKEIIVDSSVRRSLRVKKAKKGFKANPCSGKNCLACDSEPPYEVSLGGLGG